MTEEQFNKAVEKWKNFILKGPLAEYTLEIDPKILKEFAAVALFLDIQTIRASGNEEKFYEGYREASSDILKFMGIEMFQDDNKKKIALVPSSYDPEARTRLARSMWGDV
ncbi:MAG: hypothetical protein GKS04_05640 [Candidatus Mycalebacterium zealandia]|nr:MAG: hypothetical protein GKS04_05640 [Candidatus Mycalebacterium zealandia]